MIAILVQITGKVAKMAVKWWRRKKMKKKKTCVKSKHRPPEGESEKKMQPIALIIVDCWQLQWDIGRREKCSTAARKLHWAPDKHLGYRPSQYGRFYKIPYNRQDVLSLSVNEWGKKTSCTCCLTPKQGKNYIIVIVLTQRALKPLLGKCWPLAHTTWGLVFIHLLNVRKKKKKNAAAL